MARRQVEWLTGIPGTPASASAAGGSGDVKDYVTGLGEMYVADPRFAANYGGEAGAVSSVTPCRSTPRRTLGSDPLCPPGGRTLCPLRWPAVKCPAPGTAAAAAAGTKLVR